MTVGNCPNYPRFVCGDSIAELAGFAGATAKAAATSHITRVRRARQEFG
jgi:hypothetical protein